MAPVKVDGIDLQHTHLNATPYRSNSVHVQLMSWAYKDNAIDLSLKNWKAACLHTSSGQVLRCPLRFRHQPPCRPTLRRFAHLKCFPTRQRLLNLNNISTQIRGRGRGSTGGFLLNIFIECVQARAGLDTPYPEILHGKGIKTKSFWQ